MERYPGSQEPGNNTKSHCITNLTQKIHWEGRTQEGGCLLLGKNQQRTEQKKHMVYIDFLGPEIGGIFQA